MNWEDKYTPEQLMVIKRDFAGKPPEQCTGNCAICSFIIAWCQQCGWDEDFPADTLPQTQ